MLSINYGSDEVFVGLEGVLGKRVRPASGIEIPFRYACLMTCYLFIKIGQLVEPTG